MRSINFLIKPASSLCNMRCRYCFYADVAENREVANMGLMSHETAEKLIRASFADVDKNGQVNFSFQGGEPTMAGLDFYRDFVSMVEAYKPEKVSVNYALQTNGLVIDEAWARLLHDNHFLVGVSVDGDKELHDLHRVDAKQKGTYNRVAKTVRLLAKYEVDTNALCVVTGRIARHPQRVYQAIRKIGLRYMQFIPCLDPLEDERGGEKYSLKPDAYGDFLCGLFDVWYRDWESGNYASVRLFDDYVHLAMGLPPGTCATSGSCGSYFVVEGDGSLYPCDFYVLDEWKLGNINDFKSSPYLELLANSPRAREFLAEGEQKPQECASCPWVALCNGGCKRDWAVSGTQQHNYYCAAFKKFFEHSAERIYHIARLETMARRGR